MAAAEPLPPDAFDGQGWGGKVQKQTKFFARCLQVGAQARIENGLKFGDGLELNDDGVLHEEIQTVLTDVVTTEAYRDRQLTDVSEVAVV